MKMRTGLPDADIANLFHITRCTISRQLVKVRKAMKNDFVRYNLNQMMNREKLINSNTIIGRSLFCNDDPNKAVIICDGTYIYINKSTNYEFQKNTYTDQKKRNFVKVMMCVTCDGTIVQALGPYAASDNDAKILKSIFETTTAFENLKRGDVIILDRGFRDCVSFLEAKGFEVKMPSLLQRSQSKARLSTAEANTTRLVTATRYVVETRNGHLKTIFKIFNMVWNSYSLKYLKEDVNICTALINQYFKPVTSNKGIEIEIVDRMLNRLDTTNELAKVVSKQTFERNLKKFERFDNFDSLPQLTEMDLIYISLGRYQIEQAASYCQEHIKEHDCFLIFVFPEQLSREFLSSYFEDINCSPKLFLAQFKSRYISRKRHNTFVLIDQNGNGENSVLAYCCECYNGLRTVGCCSHVMCIIWFILYVKNRNIPTPASFLNNYFQHTVVG